MLYRLSYYNEAVEAELDAWPVGLRARFRALTIRMEEYGPNLGMPHTRALGNGLFEIRTKAEEVNWKSLFLHHGRAKDHNSPQFHQKDGQDAKTGTRYSAYPTEGGN